MVVCSTEDAVPFLFKIIILVIFVQLVSDSEVFQRKPMILPNMFCSVFNRTPSWLAPEEHSNGPPSGTSSRKRRRSPEEVEQEEIDACMCKVCEIDKLTDSEAIISFCFSLFEDPRIRETFNYLPKKLLRKQYVIGKYDECFPAP